MVYKDSPRLLYWDLMKYDEKTLAWFWAQKISGIHNFKCCYEARNFRLKPTALNSIALLLRDTDSKNSMT